MSIVMRWVCTMNKYRQETINCGGQSLEDETPHNASILESKSNDKIRE